MTCQASSEYDATKSVIECYIRIDGRIASHMHRRLAPKRHWPEVALQLDSRRPSLPENPIYYTISSLYYAKIGKDDTPSSNIPSPHRRFTGTCSLYHRSPVTALISRISPPSPVVPPPWVPILPPTNTIPIRSRILRTQRPLHIHRRHHPAIHRSLHAPRPPPIMRNPRVIPLQAPDQRQYQQRRSRNHTNDQSRFRTRRPAIPSAASAVIRRRIDDVGELAGCSCDLRRILGGERDRPSGVDVARGLEIDLDFSCGGSGSDGGLGDGVDFGCRHVRCRRGEGWRIQIHCLTVGCGDCGLVCLCDCCAGGED